MAGTAAAGAAAGAAGAVGAINGTLEAMELNNDPQAFGIVHLRGGGGMGSYGARVRGQKSVEP